MTDPTRFDGIFTALVTPFSDRGTIDWKALDVSIERQLAAGVTGLVPVGTTGEAATLTADEAGDVIRRTVERVAGRAYVLAGTGSNSTVKAAQATARATDLGADGVLVVTPYYNKPSQAGLIQHFGAVARATTGDVVLYSVPGRAGIAIAPHTAAALSAEHANVTAIKEAGGDVARVSDLRAAAGNNFIVHCGDDGLALAFFALGAAGLTSVFSNYDPECCVALHRAWSRGDTAHALKLHEIMRPLAEAMFIENSPAPVKYLLARDGMMSASVRLPLAELSAGSRTELDRRLDEYRRRRREVLPSEHALA